MGRFKSLWLFQAWFLAILRNSLYPFAHGPDHSIRLGMLLTMLEIVLGSLGLIGIA